MSRANVGMDVIPVRSGSNIYTVLAAVGVLIQVLTLTVLFLKYNAVFGDPSTSAWPFTMSK